MFVFKVPRVWPLDLLVNSSNSVNLQMLNKHATIVKYSTAQFIVHRVASYFTFESEVSKIAHEILLIWIN